MGQADSPLCGRTGGSSRWPKAAEKAIEQAKTNINCYKWSVTQRFLHTALPQIKVSLFFDPDTCDTDDNDSSQDYIASYLWICIIIIICALSSFFLEAF